MLYYYMLLLFIFGLIIGSFLSVIVSRIETGEGFLFGRSHCPKCKKRIRSYDLVPLLSFMVLRGRCRACEKRISPFYPLIEFITGASFAALFWRFADVFSGANFYVFLGLHLVIIASLIALFFYDWFYYMIPDKILAPVSAIVLIFALANIFLAPITGSDFFIYSAHSILSLILGVVVGGGFFLVLVLLSGEKWIGWGDVKLGAFLGLFLGFPSILIALFFSFISGSIVSLVLVLLKKKKMKDTIPFGPFLVVAALVALFAGKWIIGWYLGI